jgi:hypothetical protein
MVVLTALRAELQSRSSKAMEENADSDGVVCGTAQQDVEKMFWNAIGGGGFVVIAQFATTALAIVPLFASTRFLGVSLFASIRIAILGWLGLSWRACECTHQDEDEDRDG